MAAVDESVEVGGAAACAAAAPPDVLAQLNELKNSGNALYKAKDWQAACAAYSQAVRLAPVVSVDDSESDEEVVEQAATLLASLPQELREAVAVCYCNRSAARFAMKQYVGSLSDAQLAGQFNPTFWKVHWRAGNALLGMEARVERSEQMISSFEQCLASPTLPPKELPKGAPLNCEFTLNGTAPSVCALGCCSIQLALHA